MPGATFEQFSEAVWGRSSTSSMRVPIRAEAQEKVLSALLETPLEQKRRNPLDWLLSLIIHAVVLAVLVIVPLVFTQVIDLHNLQLTYLVAPAPPAAAPPPAPFVAQKAPAAKLLPVSPAKLTLSAALTAPAMVPRHIAIVRDAPEPEIASGVVGGIPGGTVGGVLGGIIGEAVAKPPAISAPPPASAPVVSPKAKAALRIGGNVKPPRKISAPAPEYPALAKAARVQGVVVIDATIDESGNVVNAKAMEGPPLLVSEALRTVMLWKYEPTYLNGVPYPVQMTVTVSFTMAGAHS